MRPDDFRPGQRIGLEKMVLRKGVLIGTFIADQEHSFFENGTFTAILRAVQEPRKFKVYEKAGPLSAVWRMQDVKNPAKCAGQAVQVAKAALEGVVAVTTLAHTSSFGLPSNSSIIRRAASNRTRLFFETSMFVIKRSMRWCRGMRRPATHTMANSISSGVWLVMRYNKG